MVSIPLVFSDWEIIYSYEFDQDTVDPKEWTIVNEINKCYGKFNNFNDLSRLKKCLLYYR